MSVQAKAFLSSICCDHKVARVGKVTPALLQAERGVSQPLTEPKPNGAPHQK